MAQRSVKSVHCQQWNVSTPPACAVSRLHQEVSHTVKTSGQRRYGYWFTERKPGAIQSEIRTAVVDAVRLPDMLDVSVIDAETDGDALNVLLTLGLDDAEIVEDADTDGDPVPVADVDIVAEMLGVILPLAVLLPVAVPLTDTLGETDPDCGITEHESCRRDSDRSARM